jgi:hypothetical protein
MNSYNYAATDAAGNPLTASQVMMQSLANPISSYVYRTATSNPAANVNQLASKKDKFFKSNSTVDADLLNAIWEYYNNQANQPAAESLFKDNASRAKIFKFLDNTLTDSAKADDLAIKISTYWPSAQ